MTKNPLTQNRNVNDLKPTFKQRFIFALEEYNDLYDAKVFVVETTRSKELQAKYFKEGKTKTLISNHFSGNAVDIGFAKPEELYPKDDLKRTHLCIVMRRYGIVNAYYDLKRGFDKPHFQAVEVQKPMKASESYKQTLRRKEKLKSMVKLRSGTRHRTTNLNIRERLHQRNERIRTFLDSIGEKY